MNNSLPRQLNQGQGNVLKSSQQSLGGGQEGLLLGIARIQTRQRLMFSSQRPPGHKLSQGQDPQRQGQQPDQADEMVFALQIDRTQAQGSAFEPRKISFNMSGPA